jgi:hypothetical protein
MHSDFSVEWRQGTECTDTRRCVDVFIVFVRCLLLLRLFNQGGENSDKHLGHRRAADNENVKGTEWVQSGE